MERRKGTASAVPFKEFRYTCRMSPDILIRQAEPEDGPALVAAMAAIDAETEFLGRPGEYGEWPVKASERLKIWREKDIGGYFIALDRGEIVGFLSIFRGELKRVAGAGSIPQVGLREAYRGRGIGGRLFEAAEAWACSRDMHRLELRVDEENARGRALYRRMGFEVEGAIPRAVDTDGTWRTHLIMAKRFRRFPPFPPDLDEATPVSGETLDGIVIRAPRADDAAACRAWEIQLVTELPWGAKEASDVSPEETIRADLAKGPENLRRMMLLALSGARILGLLSGGFGDHRMRGECNGGINVLRDGRGRGIGRALAERFERWAVENGARRLTCSVSTANSSGLRFAERLGYQREVMSLAAVVIDGKAVDRIRFGKLVG
jgi:RimJ/RimL family protein N-acetyltransferase